MMMKGIEKRHLMRKGIQEQQIMIKYANNIQEHQNQNFHGIMMIIKTSSNEERNSRTANNDKVCK